jgi:hypothetical protein
MLILFDDTFLDLAGFGEEAAQGEQEGGGGGEGQGEAARPPQVGVFEKEKNVFLAVEHAIGEGDKLHWHRF